MDFTKETYDKIRREMKFRHLAQQVLERVNEIYKNQKSVWKRKLLLG